AVPLILQSETAECGLACLAMVANAHGAGLTLGDLRRRFSFSSKGATVKRILEVAGEIGLRARAVRIELDDLRKMPVPCVLHWNFLHFVVLQSVEKAHAVVLDPAKGRRKVSWPELNQAFTGVAIELQPKRDFSQSVAASP